MIKIIATATGVAAILAAGSVLLATVSNSTWVVFLIAAISVFVASKVL